LLISWHPDAELKFRAANVRSSSPPTGPFARSFRTNLTFLSDGSGSDKNVRWGSSGRETKRRQPISSTTLMK
jgi:hypothetical protein